MRLLDDRQLAQLASEGFTIVHLPFEAERLDGVRREIERVSADRRRRADSRAQGHSKLLHVRPELPRMHQDSALLTAFITDPVFAALALALVGPDADVLWNQAHLKAPGGDDRTRIPWHQDGHYVQLDPPVSYSCWVALTRATLDNGALWGALLGPDRPLRPHQWDETLEYFRCEVDEKAAFPLEVQPGQAILFDTRWAHRSGPNRSSSPRIAYSLSFAAAGARLRASGERFGDQLPLVRAGRPIRELLAELARDPQRTDAAGLMAELRARGPACVAALAPLLSAYRDAPDSDESHRQLHALLSISSQEDEVNGDLVRSRTHAAQTLAEAASVLEHGDERGATLLLRRALELDPQLRVTHPRLRRLLAPRRGERLV